MLDSLSAQDALDLIAATLPADQAEVLVLRVIGELDAAHVAEVMGRTPNWVRVTQHRALRRLAEAMTQRAAVPPATVEVKNSPNRVMPTSPRAI